MVWGFWVFFRVFVVWFLFGGEVVCWFGFFLPAAFAALLGFLGEPRHGSSHGTALQGQHKNLEQAEHKKAGFLTVSF